LNNFTSIISVEELHNHLNNEELILVDCRFDLADESWGFEEYEQIHIPGAVYAHLNNDLSGAKTKKTGRHPLPDPSDFNKTCSILGISQNSQVVVYDSTEGSMASRMWFLLKYYGHKNVALLNGGLGAWLVKGYPIESGVNSNKPGNFSGHPNPKMVITSEDVKTLLKSDSYLLIDARATERFSGEIEPIDRLAGHIPGATNYPYAWNLNADGLFKSKQELKDIYTGLISDLPSEKIAVYCGSGVTSCVPLVAMQFAGLPLARLYAGSWSEWIQDDSNPIVTNKKPSA
jgi:thiosulfate/3-mercaptopyruvate sulfurtransferase